jgi:hypothetical protein
MKFNDPTNIIGLNYVPYGLNVFYMDDDIEHLTYLNMPKPNICN